MQVVVIMGDGGSKIGVCLIKDWYEIVVDCCDVFGGKIGEGCMVIGEQ